MTFASILFKDGRPTGAVDGASEPEQVNGIRSVLLDDVGGHHEPGTHREVGVVL